jgi:hypothetical protein
VEKYTEGKCMSEGVIGASSASNGPGMHKFDLQHVVLSFGKLNRGWTQESTFSEKFPIIHHGLHAGYTRLGVDARRKKVEE